MSHTLQWIRNRFALGLVVLLALCSFVAQADTYRDEFNARNAAAYTVNNGTNDWAGNWFELNDDNNPLAGNVQVYVTSNAGTRPGVRVQRNTGGGTGAWREVNLFGYTSAILSFTYQRVYLDDPNDYAAIEISADGGASWTRLATFAGPTNDALPQNFSQDISAYISANTRIRFIGSPTLGSSDRIFFDTVEILALPDKPVVLAPFAYYDFDETLWTGVAGEVLNKGSGVVNASALGVAAGVNSVVGGKMCYAANIPRNTTAALQYAVDTGIDMDSQIGATGSINFWYRSNLNWSGGGTRVLLDASEDGPPNALRRIFYLNLLTDGSLRFALQDSNQRNLRIKTGGNTFAANEWVHIAINWKLSAAPTARAEIWINGNKQTVSFEQNNLTSTALGNLQSLFIGDNRSTVYAPGGNQSANGLIDELRLYAAVMPSTNINADKNATHPCVGLVADYRFDEFAWDNSAGEVQDSSGNGLHGASVNITATNDGGTYSADPNDAPDLVPNTTPITGSCRFGRMTGPLAGNRSHVVVADNSLLDIENELTMMAWIYPLAYPTTGGLSSIISKDINSEFHLQTNGALNWWWGGGARSLTTSANVIQLRQWQHVAVVYSRADGFQRIYINGVQVAAGTNANAALTLTTAPLLIGGDIATGGSLFNDRIFDGFIDEVKIFNKALTTTQLNNERNRAHVCQQLYFGISVSGTASTCLPVDVTITAYQDAALTKKVSRHTEMATLSTSRNHGLWSKSAVAGAANGLLTPVPDTSDDGAAQYRFVSSDRGDAVLRLENQRAESLTITATGAAVPVTSSAVAFSDNAFVITEDPLQVAGKPQSMKIALWRRDTTPPATNCSIATAYAGNKALKGWIARDAVDPAGIAPTISAVSLPSAQPASTNLTLNFVAGEASFLLDTTDVGKYKLNLLDDSRTFASLVNLAAQTGSLIVRPFGFDVQAAGNPAAADADGNSYVAAGTDFNLVVKAVRWASADDSNSDGVPDNYASLSNNLVTPAYKEQSVAPKKPVLSHQLIAPMPGTDGALSASAINGFASGVATNAINFSEVGIIKLRVDDGSYLGGGAVHGETGNVGRFFPHHFALTQGTLTNRADIAGCFSGFTYMGEDLRQEFTLTAQNAATPSVTTTNYVGDFAKLNQLDDVTNAVEDELDLQFAHAGTDDLSGVRIFALNTSPIPWVAGVAAIDVNIALNRPVDDTAGLRGPYSSVVVATNPVDDDGVTINSAQDSDVTRDGANDHWNVSTDTTSLLYGRLELLPAYGPEIRNLSMPIRAMFFNGTSGWQININDCIRDILHPANSCTLYSGLTATFSGYADNLQAGETLAQFPAAPQALLAGVSDPANPFQLTASGAGNNGSVMVTLNGVANYLQYPWVHCPANTNCGPQARASFGLYRGNDRVIYWRELVR